MTGAPLTGDSVINRAQARVLRGLLDGRQPLQHQMFDAAFLIADGYLRTMPDKVGDTGPMRVGLTKKGMDEAQFVRKVTRDGTFHRYYKDN